MNPKTKRPVFIVGCPRSGTSLLYHALLSSGGFAVFRTEMNAFNLAGPIFGDLRKIGNRRALVEEWLTSKAFKVSGLRAEEIGPKLLAGCTSPGELLRIVMGEIAANQDVERWADSTPANVLFLPQIKEAFPDALVIHIIRDGRDVAISLDRLNWSRPLPWDRKASLTVAGLYWQWIVAKGCRDGNKLGRDYIEVSFEKLAQRPEETLHELAPQIGHELDYARIRETAIGAVATPSSSFGEWGRRHASVSNVQDPRPLRSATPVSQPASINPVGRWLTIPPNELAILEAAIGNSLTRFGYALATSADERARVQPRANALRTEYPAIFSAKQWLKTHTRIMRWFVRYSYPLIDK